MKTQTNRQYQKSQQKIYFANDIKNQLEWQNKFHGSEKTEYLNLKKRVLSG